MEPNKNILRERWEKWWAEAEKNETYEQKESMKKWRESQKGTTPNFDKFLDDIYIPLDNKDELDRARAVADSFIRNMSQDSNLAPPQNAILRPET